MFRIQGMGSIAMGRNVTLSVGALILIVVVVALIF
jgi:hypothetical protein